MKRRNGYLQLGLAVFLSVSAILLFYDTLFGRRVLPVFGGQLISAVQPGFDRSAAGVSAGTGGEFF